MIGFRGRSAAIVLSAAALLVAGCGSSSKTKSSTGAATVAPTPETLSTPSTSTTASGGYTEEVVTAMQPMLDEITRAVHGEDRAKGWDLVSKTAGTASYEIAALTPPAAVASLQPQLVKTLRRLATGAESARDAINSNDFPALKAAHHKTIQDAHKLDALVDKFKAAGYPI